jgi:hypothetical protein
MPDDLSALAINSTIQAVSQANANFVFTPLDAGHLLCQFSWGGPVSVKAGWPVQQLNMSAALQGTSARPDAGINLTFSTVDYKLSLKTVSPPMVAITTQYPQFFLTCATAVALGGPFLFLKKFREDLLKDTFDFKLPAQQLTVGIQPIHFQLMGSDLKLNPEWNPKTVGLKLLPISGKMNKKEENQGRLDWPIIGLRIAMSRIVIDISKSRAYVSADSANGRMKLYQASRPRVLLLADFPEN